MKSPALSFCLLHAGTADRQTRHLLAWLALSPDQRRDGAERRDGSGLELTRERDRLEIAVELEGDRLIVPVEVVRVRAQPRLRVLRPLVIAAGDLDVLVRHAVTVLPHREAAAGRPVRSVR